VAAVSFAVKCLRCDPVGNWASIVADLLNAVHACFTGCGKQHFWEVAFEITSPYYPDNYEDRLTCHYYIHNPLNSYVTITFQTFDVEYDSDCDYDYLTVSRLITSS